LAANIAAAEFLLEHEIPALYRVHEIPKAEKLEALQGFLGELGLNLGGGETPTAKDYANLINKVISDCLLTVLIYSVYSLGIIRLTQNQFFYHPDSLS